MVDSTYQPIRDITNFPSTFSAQSDSRLSWYQTTYREVIAWRRLTEVSDKHAGYIFSLPWRYRLVDKYKHFRVYFADVVWQTLDTDITGASDKSILFWSKYGGNTYIPNVIKLTFWYINAI
jgi:hypothetical protein